ncbi:hypothetical protein NLU66_12230 [Brachybacterium sp. NBEC-018]|uniref:hypothetical protein n=1 Tax=Brachybacterium sp. NBEC-018 TaxID=2996004 RepID=UPI0021756D3B|nr:hypothetical protein [Brachybacterium sp. NBEC-018]UVY82990.1 hypothetical protein NLU66_12230 [Brachybacterium sp. NBEC-018]
MTTSTHPTSRRSLMRGVAWAAPTVAMSIGAAPAIAISPTIEPALNTDSSCKETQGSKRYYLAFTIDNKGSADAEVRAIQLSVTPDSGSTVVFSGGLPTRWYPLPGKDSIEMSFRSSTSGNIANGIATATFEVRDLSGSTQNIVTTFRVDSLPPCECVPAPCSPRPANSGERGVPAENSPSTPSDGGQG